MDTNKNPHMASSLLDDLEEASGLINIVTQQDFLNVLQLDKAIIYLLVEWSGPERVSRYVIYKAFNDIKMEIPLFKTDCSHEKYINDWLVEQRKYKQGFNFGGWGETLLIEKGKIIDFIGNPGQIGLEKTIEKIKSWKRASAKYLVPN